MVELFTTRLKIRTLRDTDWPFFLRLHLDEALNKYIRPIETVDQIKDKFSCRSAPWEFASGDWLTLVIEELDSGELIGLTGIRCDDPDGHRAEVGYLLAGNHHLKGYGSESLQAVVDWTCLNFRLHRLVAYCVADNIASAKVLLKCGFRHEGRLREHFRINQEWYDEDIFGILASERQLSN